MNFGKATLVDSSLNRSSKLTLTPLSIPPSAAAYGETSSNRSSHATSLETPGRPGSARLVPLRNPPQAPPLAGDHPVNLPDVDRAPFVPQNLAAGISSSSESDDDFDFKIDVTSADPLLLPIPLAQLAPSISAPASRVQPASAESFLADKRRGSDSVPTALSVPLQRSSATSSVPTKSPPAASLLDSSLSKREKQMLELLSADEHDHLHSHALGSFTKPNSVAGGARCSGSTGRPNNSMTQHGILKPAGDVSLHHAADSSGSEKSSNAPCEPDSSVTTASMASVAALSRKGSDVQSDGSWDDDEAAKGAACCPQHQFVKFEFGCIFMDSRLPLYVFGTIIFKSS
jgi:hypothetical protein